MSKKRFNVDIDKQKLERFQKIAKAENSTASQMVRIWIDKFLAENAGKYELI